MHFFLSIRPYPFNGVITKVKCLQLDGEIVGSYDKDEKRQTCGGIEMSEREGSGGIWTFVWLFMFSIRFSLFLSLNCINASFSTWCEVIIFVSDVKGDCPKWLEKISHFPLGETLHHSLFKSFIEKIPSKKRKRCDFHKQIQ